jgi:hypothetical protein
VRANEVFGQAREGAARPHVRAIRLQVPPARVSGLELHDQPGPASQGAAEAATRAPFFSARFVAGGLLVVIAVVFWRATVSYPTGVFDFYPLYYGAKAWLHGGNAYAMVDASSSHSSLLRSGSLRQWPCS